MVAYCNASWLGVNGHQAILFVHLGYLLAAASAFHFIRNRLGRTSTQASATFSGAWLLPAAALTYAIVSMLWHVSGNRIFNIGDGAVSVFFLLALSSWAKKPRPIHSLALLPAFAAALYIPIYTAIGEPAYFAAMTACGIPFLVMIIQEFQKSSDMLFVWRKASWFFAALTSILIALVAVRSDAAWCGHTGFVTGHTAAHFFDSICFFFLLQGSLRWGFNQEISMGRISGGAGTFRAPDATHRQSRP